MSFTAATLILLMVALGVAAVAFIRAAGRSRLAWWRKLADAQKLRLDEGREPHDAVLKGVYKGVRVEVSVGSGRVPPPLKLFTRIIAELPGAGPPGLLLTSEQSLLDRLRRNPAPAVEIDDPEIGGAFSVHGHDQDKTTEVVLSPSVREPLLELRRRSDLVHVDEIAVQVEIQGISGPDLHVLVELACRAAAGISESFEQAWADFAKQHGLMFLGAGTRGERTLRGYMNGTRVTIQTGPMPENPELQFSTIKVAVPEKLPSGLRIMPRAFSPELRGEIEIGDDRIDSIVRVQSTNRDAVRALLTHPQLRDHLSAFYEVCPYTMVEAGLVIAGGPGLIGGDLEGQVAAVDELARSFAEAWRAVTGVEDDGPERATGTSG